MALDCVKRSRRHAWVSLCSCAEYMKRMQVGHRAGACLCIGDGHHELSTGFGDAGSLCLASHHEACDILHVKQTR